MSTSQWEWEEMRKLHHPEEFTSMAQQRRFERLKNGIKKETTAGSDEEAGKQHDDNRDGENLGGASGQHPSGS
jgi:hypothetical protein